MRQVLERLLFDLRFDMDCIGEEEELWEEIKAGTDAELAAAILDYLDEQEFRREIILNGAGSF